jgi:hypothetical protein
MKTVALLAAFGFPLTLIGAGGVLLLPDILPPPAGMFCDPDPCPNPAAVPLFVLALVVFIVGLVMVGLAAWKVRSVR